MQSKIANSFSQAYAKFQRKIGIKLSEFALGH